MDVNLKSMFFVCQAMGRKALAAGRGARIVNIASMLSFQGGIRGASYTASVAAPKAAAVKAAKLNGQRKTKIGSLMTEQGSRPSLTDITCTVSGSRETE